MRSERLLILLQILRQQSRPVSGKFLSNKLKISIRTLYRDIADLQAMGADIQGEPGVGYVLRGGFFLPPLMFSRTEIEALILGIKWVSSFADKPLADASMDALAKIGAVIPPEIANPTDMVSLRVGPPSEKKLSRENLNSLRKAIRNERKINIDYEDASGRKTTRIIWPFAIGYFVDGRILVGWCEKRAGYRHFKTERIASVRTIKEPYPKRKSELLKEWKKLQRKNILNK
ncbi:MAG: YafY family transcriptional regulator [Rhodospirillaceae bacterium]|nr:YafY family transcriptional regulator [Rhodospirillaceae bacterium]